MTGPWDRLLTTAWRDWRDILADGDEDEADWRQAALTGGLPVPALEMETAEQRELWYAGYVQTHLERDLQAVRAVAKLVDFRRLMRAACLLIGGLVNQTDLGRDVGISQPQVHRFLNLMETTYQAVRLPAYAVNRTRRLIKAPDPTDPGGAVVVPVLTPTPVNLEGIPQAPPLPRTPRPILSIGAG